MKTNKTKKGILDSVTSLSDSIIESAKSKSNNLVEGIKETPTMIKTAAKEMPGKVKKAIDDELTISPKDKGLNRIRKKMMYRGTPVGDAIIRTIDDLNGDDIKTKSFVETMGDVATKFGDNFKQSVVEETIYEDMPLTSDIHEAGKDKGHIQGLGKGMELSEEVFRANHEKLQKEFDKLKKINQELREILNQLLIEKNK